MKLPLEIFQDVARRLSRKDLKQLRLVCKQFSEHLVPLLYDSVFLAIDSLELERAECILAHFKSSIKSVVVSPIKYPDLTLKQYRNCVVTLADETSFLPRLPYRSKVGEHVKKSYENYCIVQQRGSVDGLEERMYHLLRTLLQNAPSLKKVVLTHRHRNIDLADIE